MSEHTGRKIPATAVGCRTVKPWEILALWLQGCGGPWRRNLSLEKALRIVDVLSPRWPCEVVQWGRRPPTLSAAMFEFRLVEGNKTTVYNNIYIIYLYIIYIWDYIQYTHIQTPTYWIIFLHRSTIHSLRANLGLEDQIVVLGTMFVIEGTANGMCHEL